MLYCVTVDDNVFSIHEMEVIEVVDSLKDDSCLSLPTSLIVSCRFQWMPGMV